jgi:hypothetical protein
MNYTFVTPEGVELVVQRKIDDRDVPPTVEEITEGVGVQYKDCVFTRKIETGGFVLQGRGWARDKYEINHRRPN